jgi:hypothetical protein
MFFMNLFKKFVASVALTVLVASIATTGVSAAASSDVEAANKLAAAGIINDHSSNTAAYNLGDNVLRQEIAKVAANVAGLSPKTTCGNSFSDVSATTPNNWACSYVEALLDNGLVSANATFRPEASISKSEALKMMLEAAGYEDIFSDVNMWQSQTVAFAVENGVIASSFSDYNTMATRGWIFRVASDARDAVAAVDEEDDFGDDLLGDLLGGLDFGDDETTDEETTDEETTDTPVFSGDNVLTVSLSPDTADSATVPASVNGLPVASFDFTAGAEDVTVTQLTVQRRGLSDAQTITALAVYTEEGRASNSKNDNQENDTQAQLNLNQGGVVVKAGQTRTITIVVDLGNAATAGQDEFALELVNVVANSNVE